MIFLVIWNICKQYTLAQEGGLKVFELPEKYIMTDESSNLLPDPENIIRGRVWVVYSDRENNKTYRSPGKNSRILISDIPFLEKFYVIDETNEYLHIIKENNLSSRFTVSRNAKDYGWIPKNKLLMWENCLVTANNKSLKRVILYNSGTNSIDFLYSSPKLSTVISHFSMQPPAILYVYKETPNSLLVATNKRISNLDKHGYALGWVSSQRLVRWNYPVCLEPNWDKDAVKERIKNNVEPEIFSSINKAEKFKKGKKLIHFLWKSDNTESINYGRFSGEFFRLPIIADFNGGLSEVIIMDKTSHKAYGKSGYAAESVNHLKYPIFRKVLFLSRIELSNIIRDYNLLITAYIRGRANELQTTFLQLLKSKTGKTDDTWFLNLSIGETTQILYGAKSESDLTNLKLRSLVNLSIITPPDLGNYINRLKTNATHLNMIFNNDKYQYSFKMFNEIYYWIPVSLIP